MSTISVPVASVRRIVVEAFQEPHTIRGIPTRHTPSRVVPVYDDPYALEQCPRCGRVVDPTHQCSAE